MSCWITFALATRGSPCASSWFARSASVDLGKCVGQDLDVAECFIGLKRVQAFTDNFAVGRSRVSLCGSTGPISSNTNLTVWSLNSALYSFFSGASRSFRNGEGPAATLRWVQFLGTAFG